MQKKKSFHKAKKTCTNKILAQLSHHLSQPTASQTSTQWLCPYLDSLSPACTVHVWSKHNLSAAEHSYGWTQWTMCWVRRSRRSRNCDSPIIRPGVFNVAANRKGNSETDKGNFKCKCTSIDSHADNRFGSRKDFTEEYHMPLCSA